MPAATKKSSQLSLRDRLSRLSLIQAEKLLGAEGKQLIMEGGRETLEPDDHVSLDEDTFVLSYPLTGETVVISLHPSRRDRLMIECSFCGHNACVHKGAALAFILEEKTLLGLAAAPVEKRPLELLGEKEVLEWALSDRHERARTETMRIRSQDTSTPWADYLVTSAASGKTYRVALRGLERGQSYCSCPDFRKNTLGACKHVLHVMDKVRGKFPAARLKEAWRTEQFLVSVAYDEEIALRLEIPEGLSAEEEALARPFRDRRFSDPETLLQLLAAVHKLEQGGRDVTIYPDAEEMMSRLLHQHRVATRMAEIRAQVNSHPLRKSLLKTELLPYQLDGIAFAAGCGRAILADDMGLGKTIQGIGVAEMLRREAGVSKVLVVCPASLKAQWAAEVRRFSDHDCRQVLGASSERREQYSSSAFFTVCNYEQVMRDLPLIEQVNWDLIILDEGQRIKNWASKTSTVIKGLRSTYALVLTGTPLENRLEELYSIVEFIDDRRLGPAFRFFHRHRVVDEKGKVKGYRNLAELRQTLEPILLRRTRQSVLQQLPPRTTEIVRIEPTGEQADFDGEQMRIVSTIVRKRFLTEMDLHRLQKALLLARMSADSTFLVYKKEPAYSSKRERLRELLESLCAEEDRKIILFSEWTTMLDLIQEDIRALGVQFVRLDGSVPQKKRQQLVHQFQEDPACRIFLATNAGSTGLNLQAANTVINVDLPWNPAILEQRIGRAHRMGQQRPVQVYLLVTEHTIEEKLLATLTAKDQLARAALNLDSELDQVDLSSGMEELRRRLEVLLGAKEEAPKDQSQQARVREEAGAITERKARVAEAGGQLLTAAFAFLGEMLPPVTDESAPKNAAAAEFVRENLRQCLETDENGKLRLTVTLPDQSALDQLAATLARLAGGMG